MTNKLFTASLIFSLLSFLLSGCHQQNQQVTVEQVSENVITDPLPSWNDGNSKNAIIDFVTKTTTEGSSDFIPSTDRIAVFDNDGTLWGEQPYYFQLAFALDQIKASAEFHPEWKSKQPFKAVLENDMATVLGSGKKGLMEIMAITHSGMTTEVFNNSVKNWIATATHPKTGKKYNEMVYQPMVELLEYLRANDFKTFIVSGGGVDFMRVWAEEAYGIPPYQIVGSMGGYEYEMRNDTAVVIKLPEIAFIDDKKEKPVGILRSIGKVPVFAVGNSDGDYEMLQFTTTATGYPRFGMFVHHTDSIREWAYDRESHIGKLSKGLEDSTKYNWVIADMKTDWKKIYKFE